MKDLMTSTEKPPELTYPMASEPQTGDGSAVSITSGVLWLRMPLFASLKWINVWALADGDGWALVDTGLNSPETLQAWSAAFAGPMAGRPATRVLVTHMHPDHCGMAGWLAERFKVALWMSQLEYLTCRVMAADTGRAPPHAGVSFYHAAGWDVSDIDAYKAKFGGFGRMIHALPDSYRRLQDHERLKIGDHEWHVVMGNGHSPEHVCLHCPDLKLFISGDQVLPRITSNVSVYPTEPDADPLSDWLNSLAKIKTRVPDDVLVLPAHNSPFVGLHARIDELIQSHIDGLSRLEMLLSEPRRATDVFSALFARPITPLVLGMATGEATAHLNHLLRTGRALSTVDASGVRWWRRP
jgi:glyoxylase-like metal-dependent hydrolase (beta-lactamase superfamily II)